MADVIEATAREAEPADDGGFDYVEPAERPAPVPAVIERGNEAVSAAAEAVMAMPGVAGRDEFLSLCMQARILSMSGAAPEAIRGNPYVAFHVAMVGRDLGLSPSAAIELIDVIPGKNGPQLSLSPQLMNAQAQRVYGGEIVKAYSQVDSCTAVAIGPGGRDPRCRRSWPTNQRRGEEPLHWAEDCSCDVIGEATFDWEDARMAGLVGPSCQPGAHVKDQTRQGRGGTYKVCGCNQGYITYPKRMFWQRSCGFAADDYFPGAGLGLYTPEALGAMVDEEGRAIDPATVALPEGYEPEPEPEDPPADPEALWELQTRLHALPEEQQLAWREQKMKQERLQGRPTHELTAPAFRIAQALVGGLEAAAKRKGYDPAEGMDRIRVLVASKLIGVLVVSPQEGEEPSPDPASEPAPDPVADLVADLEQSVANAREAAAAVEAHRAEAEATPGPTAADVAALTAQIAVTVDEMKVAEVRKDLADYQLDTSGSAPEVRARLVHKMVEVHLEGEEPF